MHYIQISMCIVAASCTSKSRLALAALLLLEYLHGVSVLHSVVSWGVLRPQSGAIEGEADSLETEALPAAVCVHQLSERRSLLDLEVHNCPVLIRHLQVE